MLNVPDALPIFGACTGYMYGNAASAVVCSSTVPLINLAAQATNTIVGNATAGSLAPTALAIGSCSAASSALTWTTNSGFGCNTLVAGVANPTATIGLIAVNGTANTALRSDGAPALSQAIVPTWSGIHTFSAAPVFSLGAKYSGSGSGTVTVIAAATAGTPTITWGNTSGTPAVTASSPLVLSTTTGNLTCTTCATTTNGGALSGTAPVALSAGGVISITGAAGQVLAGSGPVFTATPTLGTAGSVVGSLAFANATSGTITLQPATGALGSVSATLPANTGTLAETNFAQTWSATQNFNTNILKVNGATSGSLILNCAATCGTNTLTFPGGTTDFSATGGASQVVQQASSGAAFTVGRLACADLSNGAAGCSQAFGTGVATALAVNVGTAGAIVVNGGALGTPSSGTLSSATGLPISTGVSGLGTGIATALAFNTGSAGAPVLFNGAGGTPSSLTLTNATALPAASVSSGALANGMTAATQAVNDNSTKLATTAYVQAQTIVPSQLSLSQISNVLAANVNLNNTGTFFDGPSIAQGTTGTWWASGQVQVQDSAASASFCGKLWDGTTVIAEICTNSLAANQPVTISMSGYLATPAGNLRISVIDGSSTNGTIRANGTGANKASTIYAFRIN